MQQNFENIFNVKHLDALVKRINPQAIIVVDTNVVMNCPDFATWQTDIINPIFVIVQQLYFELSYKLKKEDDAKTKAITAIKNIRKLHQSGDLIKGHQINSVGHFIFLENSSRTQLDSVIDDKPEKAVLKAGDTIYLYVTEELTNRNNIPVILLTNDQGLLLLAEPKGLKTCDTRSFPIQLKDVINKQIDPNMKKVNWDKELKKVQMAGAKQVATIELTLQSKSFEPEEDFKTTDGQMIKGAIIAKGAGLLKYENSDFLFSWKLPYRPEVPKNIRTIFRTVIKTTKNSKWHRIQGISFDTEPEFDDGYDIEFEPIFECNFNERDNPEWIMKSIQEQLLLITHSVNSTVTVQSPISIASMSILTLLIHEFGAYQDFGTHQDYYDVSFDRWTEDKGTLLQGLSGDEDAFWFMLGDWESYFENYKDFMKKTAFYIKKYPGFAQYIIEKMLLTWNIGAKITLEIRSSTESRLRMYKEGMGLSN